MDNKKLAELLFPAIDKTPADYESAYPLRTGQTMATGGSLQGTIVTRLGPSPTGFIHLGNLYGAFVDERFAHQAGGTFMLRIEDTDDKRFVEGAEAIVIDSLDYFGIHFDEGATKEGDKGEYGPYHQSQRAEIYQSYVKDLVAQGKAYPCFLTEDEIGTIREGQEQAKLTPGIYGEFAACRNLCYEDVEARLQRGDQYVIRLHSEGNPDNPATITVNDAIRGELTMPENFQDVVILKAMGLPTYHFAHAVDDHLMRVTHVVRGEEWLSSLPIHYELFGALGFALPVYCHTAVLMKLDNGNKRKLSKRKDPELALDYYKELGYHPAAVREYLMTILNSNYEEWRADNPATPLEDFDFTLEKMSTGGALFDMDKLNDVSKDTLVKIKAEDLYAFLSGWAKEYQPAAADSLADKDYLLKILDLGRSGDKPRKDFVSAGQMWDFISYFFDDRFTIDEELPKQVSKEDAAEILTRYLETYNHGDDQSTWFEKIRVITGDMGYAIKPKDYKKNPDDYKGHVGHVSGVVRLAIVGRSQSPDVWEIQQILGEERTRARVDNFIAGL